VNAADRLLTRPSASSNDWGSTAGAWEARIRPLPNGWARWPPARPEHPRLNPVWSHVRRERRGWALADIDRRRHTTRLVAQRRWALLLRRQRSVDRSPRSGQGHDIHTRQTGEGAERKICHRLDDTRLRSALLRCLGGL